MGVLFVMFQLSADVGRKNLGPGMPTSQIKIIGDPCPLIKKSMSRFDPCRSHNAPLTYSLWD